jgi:predicted Rossmann fold nucleotide-binding protein DprA/Smf involved in DNA uptake
MKIISGGQTGVDRAALDFAIDHGAEHGGWCPLGRLAEDGRIDSRYHLRETDSAEYDVRTRQNVIDSEATLIFVRERGLKGGTALTHDAAVELDRPVLVVYEDDGVGRSARRGVAFVNQHAVKILNVAGPRESEAPGLDWFVAGVLEGIVKNR